MNIRDLGFVYAYGAINDPCVLVIFADRMQLALEIDACATDVTSLGWGGVGMLTFMLTCVTCTTDVTSLGRGGTGMLTFMLTCVACTTDVTSLGWGGVGMLTFMLTCVTCTTDVTSLGRGGGGDVNVHVNLRHMRNWRHVTGLGWGGDVNVHVNLRHMHNWRHVTGLGWGGDVNAHVNLRHMHNWRHVTGKGELKNEFCWMTGWSDVTESVQQKRKKTIITLFKRVENRWTFHTKRTFCSWPQCNYDLTFFSRFYKTLQIPWFGERSIMKNPWVTPGR